MDLKAIVQQLRADDPSVRKKAIRQLAKTRDARVIKPLQWVQQNDPDAGLRELARKAIVYIQQQNEAAPPPKPEPQPPMEPYTSPFEFGNLAQDSPPKVKPLNTPPQRKVSERDRRMATTLVERAMNLNLKGELSDAMDAITHAFALNPELTNDMMAMGLATQLLQTNEREATRILTDPAVTAQYAGRSTKGKSAQASEDDLYAAIFWLILYFVIFFGIVIGAWYFFREVIEVALDDPEITDEERQVFRIFQDISPQVIIVFGIASATMQTLLYMFWVYLQHLVASTVFMGRGAYVRLLKNLTAFTIVFTLLGAALVGAAFIDVAFLTLLCFGGPFLLIGSVYLYTKIIMNEYDIGFTGGCMTIVLAYVIYYFANALLQGILQQIFTSF